MTDGTYRQAIALASTRKGKFTFLIHRSVESPGYCCTYAPVGLNAGGPYSTIQRAIASLHEISSDYIVRDIQRNLDNMAARHEPLLAPETGIPVTDWRKCEACRFRAGEYSPVPAVCGLTYPAEHYLHLSVTKTETDFVAYTPNESYGVQDKQVRLRFGKYLRKAFPTLDDATIQRAVTELRAALALLDSPATLHFATDLETINEIFETRMRACDSSADSCMYGKFADWPIRPYHVYADSPDVAVAYIRERGEIIARSVVSTKDKVWIRPYAVSGDSAKCEMLKSMLRELGYSHGNLEGNRLTQLNTNYVMLPYLDGDANQVIRNGRYWEVVSSDGEYEADNTDGSATECDCECSTYECCEEQYHEERNCTCLFCSDCDRCIEHDGCNCERCEECNRRINSDYYGTCRCSRCDECHELTDSCECESEDETEDESTQEAVA